jgi:proteasome lid subunit RPN8/RPN11
VITVVQRVLDDVQAHAREAAPRECCGLLVGLEGRILESVRARNLEEGTTRFQIDPRDHIRAIRDARERDLDVVGFYHSHPRSRAFPSETDVAEAGYAGAVHLIAGVDEHGAQQARLFRIDGEDVQELEMAVQESG